MIPENLENFQTIYFVTIIFILMKTVFNFITIVCTKAVSKVYNIIYNFVMLNSTPCERAK